MTARFETVRSFWVGGKLPDAQAACLQSYLAQGHPVELFCYEKPEGTPEEIVIRNAREIMLEEEVFAYGSASGAGKGSFSACSNIFRYTLLYFVGGYWVDTDLFCLKPLPNQEIVIPQEITKKGQPTAASCILKAPAGHPFSRFCLNAALEIERDKLRFGEIGPRLVQRAVDALDLGKYVFSPTDFCPINYTECDKLTSEGGLPSTAYTVHLWNEIWRRKGRMIPWPGPKGALLEKLSQRLNCHQEAMAVP